MSETSTVNTVCGAKTSSGPRLDLIPRRSLERLAARFEKGTLRYGKDNWRKGLSDPSYVTERLAHTIAHCYRLIDKLEGRLPEDGEDDASAIMWGGAFACEATEPEPITEIHPDKKPQNA